VDPKPVIVDPKPVRESMGASSRALKIARLLA